MSDTTKGVKETGSQLSLKVRARLVLGFSSICLILIIVVGITIFHIGGVVDRAHRIDELRLPSVIAINGMVGDIQASRIALRDWMLTGDQSHKAARAQAWARMEAHRAAMDVLSKNWTDPENVRRWEELKGLLREFQATQQMVEDAAGGRDGALLATEAAPRAETLLATLLGELQADGSRAGGMADNQIKLMSSDVEKMLSGMLNLMTLVWLLLSIGLSISIVVVLITSRSIVNPLVALTDAANGLAAGDHSRDIPATDKLDEIGDLARAVQSLKDNMRR